MNITGGEITVVTTGNGSWDEDDLDTKAACGLSADGNMNISGSSTVLNLTAKGSGGKGMKCDGVMTIDDGTITILTSGGLYYNNGTTENTNYTGNTDNVSSNYYSSPKGIKAGLKTESGNSYTYSGGLVINGGNIIINAYDDAINAAQDLTVSSGTEILG